MQSSLFALSCGISSIIGVAAIWLFIAIRYRVRPPRLSLLQGLLAVAVGICSLFFIVGQFYLASFLFDHFHLQVDHDMRVLHTLTWVIVAITTGVCRIVVLEKKHGKEM